MKKTFAVGLAVSILVFLTAVRAPLFSGKNPIGINVLAKTDIQDVHLAQLAQYGTILNVMDKIDAVIMLAPRSSLRSIRALPFVAAANPDAARYGIPVDTVEAEDFADGLNTWNLDAVDVTDFGMGRTIEYDGDGVYVAVLDTGLLDSWRQYFPEERIAVQYAVAFGGAGSVNGRIVVQPGKWERDHNSHGTHVTSTIIGYDYRGTSINGVAPLATVIPVKVLNQNGSGWSSVIAHGITYVADLKGGPLNRYPVVINMSLGGPGLDAVEKAAIDYALSKGVIIVASAGNEGTAGMDYPGAYAPVISVAASGWIGEWTDTSWWRTLDVADPIDPDDFYITDFSGRELAGQDLDVTAPGSWVVGPYEVNSKEPTYYYLGGTSMASPHVAGIVALMLQKNRQLTAAEVEEILETSAIYMAPGSKDIYDPDFGWITFTWGDDATGAGLTTAEQALSFTPPHGGN